MKAELIRIEVERICNLVRGFGWEKVKEEQVEGNVEITFRKGVEVPLEDSGGIAA